MSFSRSSLFLAIRNARNGWKSRADLAAAVRNIGWLSFDNIFRLSLTLIIGVLIARYLGPTQFGILSYAAAFVAVIGSFAGLGLQGIVVRELVMEPHRARVILGSALLLQFVAAASASALAAFAVRLANAGDPTTIGLVSILALGLPLQSSATIRYWFESRVLSKYVVWIDNIIFLCVFVIKLFLILSQASLPAFAWVTLLQSFLTALGLVIIYVLTFPHSGYWQPQWNECLHLLRQCWPLALSSIAILVYLRTDQLMLNSMLGNESVGIYSAALRLSEVWYMIPVIVMASVFPAILRAKQNDTTLYRNRLQQLLSALVIIALLVAALVSALAPLIISTVFGNQFAASAGVLAIHMWTSVFVFLGVASGSWLIAEGLQLYSFYRTACGAVINVGANLILIPAYGPVGAAIATLVSQLVAAYLMDLVSPQTRDMFMMKTRALMLWRHNFSRT
jgi:PST family polysaccharide transporter